MSTSSLTIGTHDGAFHCDEALACFMLQQTELARNAPIVRTRDMKVLDTLPINIDVGAVYDPSRHRYDHHQRGFAETLSSEHTMKLSTAGLIYKHFGREVIRSVIAPRTLNDEQLESVYRHVYGSFIEAIDGIDNGINQYGPNQGKPVYRVNTDLSSRVGYLNPDWNQTATREEIDERFLKAVKLTGAELVDAVNFSVNSWLPAREVVARAMSERFSVHPSGQIIAFTKERPIWKSHLFAIEKELGLSGDDSKHIIYVLFEDVAAKKWRVQAVPDEASDFASRKALPEPWRGVRDAQLSELSGIPGGVFVHAAGFIGGNDTYEGALAMAERGLTWESESNKKAKMDTQ